MNNIELFHPGTHPPVLQLERQSMIEVEDEILDEEIMFNGVSTWALFLSYFIKYKQICLITY